MGKARDCNVDKTKNIIRSLSVAPGYSGGYSGQYLSLFWIVAKVNNINPHKAMHICPVLC